MKPFIILMILVITALTVFSSCELNETEEKTARASCVLSPDVIDFGEVRVGELKRETFTLTTGGNPNYTTFNFRLALEGCSSDIDISFNEELLGVVEDYIQVGAARLCTLVIEPTEADYHECLLNGKEVNVTEDQASITVRGYSLEHCIFSRNDIDFGQVEIGAFGEDTFTVNNISHPYYAQNIDVSLQLGSCAGGVWFVENENELTTSKLWQLAPGEAAICTLRYLPQAVEVIDCELWTGAQYCCGPLRVTGTGISSSSPSDWVICEQGTYPDLHGVWGITDKYVRVVGDDGIVLENSDNCSWSQVQHGFGDIDLRDVWGYGETSYWVAGGGVDDYTNSAVILQNDNGTWTEFDPGSLLDHYMCVWGKSNNDVYFLGMGISTDFPNGKYFNGTTLDTMIVDMGWAEVTDVWGSGPEDVWFVLNQQYKNVWRFNGTSRSSSWESWMNQQLHGVWVAGNGEVFAVGANGAIYHYTGSAWEDQSISGLSKKFYDVWGSSESDVFAVGEDATIYHYNGGSWEAQGVPPAVTETLYGVWGSSSTDVYAVGAYGTIIHYSP